MGIYKPLALQNDLKMLHPRKQGIVVSTRQGLPVLIMAEVLHTAMYWIVSGSFQGSESL